MSAAAPPAALLAGGRAFLLPRDAEPLPGTVLRPPPLAAPGLLGIALLDGEAVPVLAAGPGLPGGPAWVRLDTPAGRVVVAGEALADPAPPGAAPLRLPGVAPRPPPRAMARPSAAGGALQADADPGAGAAVRPPQAAAGLPAALAAELGRRRVALPLAAIERVLLSPPLHPVPGGGAATAGLAVVEGAPVLVLRLAAPDGGVLPDRAGGADTPATARGAGLPLPAREADAPAAAPGADAPGTGGEHSTAALLVVFRHRGQRLGLCCTRVGPARPDDPPLLPLLDDAGPPRHPAPLAAAAPPPEAEPMRALLLLRVAGFELALPAEEVVAVIPPGEPVRLPASPGRSGGAAAPDDPAATPRGVVAHRGEVLPVLDAGLRLGGRPVLDGPGAVAPMLRLAGARPVALAVSQVIGLRRVPARLVTRVAEGGPVAELAILGAAPLPVCRAAALAAERHAHAGAERHAHAGAERQGDAAPGAAA